ncbi:MAG: hypothetical protein AB7I27_00410 [Bacteriovoracaceae bacterium]
MSRSYTFKRDSGDVEIMTLLEASTKIHEPDIKRRFEEIILNSQNKRRKKDGFTPGWQENINAYAGGRMEYDRLLKERGLVELGNDYIPQEAKGDYNFCQTEEFIQTCLEEGIDLSGNEIDAIKSGEYFKNIELNND